MRNEKNNDKTLQSLAEKHSKTSAQILLRYCVDKGWVPLPKSDTPSRIEANADVFDFALEKEDIDALDSLDQGERGALVMVVKN